MTHVNLKKKNLKNDGILSFVVKQEKRVHNIKKTWCVYNSASEEPRSLKAVGLGQV